MRNGKSFETGFAEADAGWVMVDRELVEQLGGRSSLLEIVVEDPLQTAALSKSVQAVLGDEFLVTDWRQFNRELFTALRLQKVALFLVLGLIVVVATFNVASTLVVLARERRREVGVLAAMGLGRRSLTAVFLLCGLALGGVGALLGVAFGWLVAWVLTTFELIHFDPGVAAIYFISSVPFRVESVGRAGGAALEPGGDAGRLLDPRLARRRSTAQRGAALRLSLVRRPHQACFGLVRSVRCRRSCPAEPTRRRSRNKTRDPARSYI